MSKITISAILAVLRLAISAVQKVIRLIYTIIDFVDDGVVNQSVERPDWVVSLASAITSLEEILANFDVVENDLISM